MYRLFIILGILFLGSCKDQKEDFTSARVEDYFPLEVGRYAIYDLDSVLFTNFGQSQITLSYQVKDVTESVFQDNTGNKSFLIVRYIRKNDQQPWIPDNTFTATNVSNSLEYVENNLRFIKLKQPVRNGFSWSGNRYIDGYPSDEDLRYLERWLYTYDSVGYTATVNEQTFTNTICVNERDEFLGQNPEIPGTPYAEKTFSKSKYAKNVGLIYREFMHWEYQGARPGVPAYYNGYGIIQKIKDYR